MRRTFLIPALCATLAGAALTLATPAERALAVMPSDAAKDALMAAASGEFGEAEKILNDASDEVKQDYKLRMRLAKLALTSTKAKDGVEKVPGLIFAKNQFGAANEVEPNDPESAIAALETALDLVAIQVEAKQPTQALRHADWAVKVGEAALAEGADVPDLKMAIAASRDERAKLSHKIEDFDRIVGDYDRSAELSVSCADTARKPADALSAAARSYLALAAFIAEGRPLEDETRDEAALLKALDTAKQACEMKGADEDQFTVHLLALIAIHRAKKEGSTFEREDFGRPYMQELGKREGIKGLPLFVPKADGWKKLDNSGDWELIYDRQIEGDTSAVRFMLIGHDHSESYGGITYNQVEKLAKRRFESETENSMKDVSSKREPEQIKVSKKRKGCEIWQYEVAGTLSNGRNVRLIDTMYVPTKKAGITYRIRIVDYRRTPDLTEPDIVEFLDRALGLAVEEDDGKKKKKKKRK